MDGQLIVMISYLVPMFEQIWKINESYKAMMT